MSKTAEAIKQTVPDNVKPLPLARIVEAPFARNLWAITLLPGQTFDDVTRPGFFKLSAQRMELNDALEIQPANLQGEARYKVVQHNRTSGEVVVRQVYRTEWDAPDLGTINSDTYYVEHTGDVITGFRVVRKADGKVMRDNFRRQEDAKHFISSDLNPRNSGGR